jgi:hypothetical protein
MSWLRKPVALDNVGKKMLRERKIPRSAAPATVSALTICRRLFGSGQAPALNAALCAVRYKRSGEPQIQKQSEIRRRLGESLHRGDAVVLAYYGGITQ